MIELYFVDGHSKEYSREATADLGPESFVEKALEMGGDVIGSDCGNGSENMERVATELRKHMSSPLIIQSNAGTGEWSPCVSGATGVLRRTVPETC